MAELQGAVAVEDGEAVARGAEGDRADAGLPRQRGDDLAADRVPQPGRPVVVDHRREEAVGGERHVDDPVHRSETVSINSSPAMLEQARSQTGAGWRFGQGDLADWAPVVAVDAALVNDSAVGA